MVELTHTNKTFSFSIDGEVYTIPAVTSAPATLVTGMLGKTPQEQGDMAMEYVVKILPDGVLERLDTTSLVELVREWGKDGGATVGESSTSSD